MGSMKKPQTLTDANVFINGNHHLGVSSKVKLPKIDFLRDVQKAGGFERDLFNGILGKMEAEISLREFSKSAYGAVKNAWESADRAKFRVKANYHVDGKDYPVVANFNGNANVEDSPLEAGKGVERVLKISVTFADLTIDGKQEYQIDTDNMVCIIEGKDLFSTLRANLI
jgi:P2 family phage contractile tail tube protein